MKNGMTAAFSMKSLLELFLPLYPPDFVESLTTPSSLGVSHDGDSMLVENAIDAATRFQLFVSRPPESLLLDFSDASVHRLSMWLTRERRDEMAHIGAVGSSENLLFNCIIHATFYVGECIVRNHAGRWVWNRPQWESQIFLESFAGKALISPFRWLLKSLDDGASAGLGERYRTYVENTCFDFLSLPPIVQESKLKFPLKRIEKGVRYDVLHRYLKNQVPELSDLGLDFPSPERFAAYQFHWLGFMWLGQGRMLLIYGYGEGGLHLIWLDYKGFQKAAFYPCHSFPEPKVTLKKKEAPAVDILQIHLTHDSKNLVHELLFWGP